MLILRTQPPSHTSNSRLRPSMCVCFPVSIVYQLTFSQLATRSFSPLIEPSDIYPKAEHSMAPNTWRAYGYKTVIGGLFSALGLLLASLLGPFVLRIFHRRTTAAAPISQAAQVPLIRISKPYIAEDNETETKPPTPATRREVHAINDSTSPARSEPMRHSQPEDFFNFVSMLPAPTLEYETQPQRATETTSTHQQRVSQKVLPSGQLKTVFESQNGGNGRRWKRRTIIFGADTTPQSPIPTPA